MISSLSVVVPAHNEEASLVQAVLRADDLLRPSVGKDLEWLVVDDGSTDTTYSEITRLRALAPNVVPLRHVERRGLGAAIWTGIAAASMDWCTWLPADGQFHPQCLVDMLALARGSDLVLLMRDEGQREQSRRLLTLALYGMMRLAFGLDLYGFSGIFMGPRETVQEIPLLATTGVQNYAVAIHFRNNGAALQQLSSVVQPRISGSSRVANLRTVLHVLYEVLRLRLLL